MLVGTDLSHYYPKTLQTLTRASPQTTPCLIHVAAEIESNPPPFIGHLLSMASRRVDRDFGL